MIAVARIRAQDYSKFFLADSPNEIHPNSLALSVERAAHISSLVAASGIEQDLIISAGVGAMEPLRIENDEADRSFNRSVTIKTSLKVPPHNERSQ